MARPAGFFHPVFSETGQPSAVQIACAICRTGRFSPTRKATKKPWRQAFILMARPAGLEPATLGFEARYSIQLSYKRAAEVILTDRQRVTMRDGVNTANGVI